MIKLLPSFIILEPATGKGALAITLETSGTKLLLKYHAATVNCIDDAVDGSGVRVVVNVGVEDGVIVGLGVTVGVEVIVDD